MVADATVEPHRYTVDTILHAHEPYPCTVCGKERNDPSHRKPPDDRPHGQL